MADNENRFRNFDAARAERRGEPVTFQLCGQTFTTLSRIPVQAFEVWDQASGEGVGQVSGLLQFILSALQPEDRPKFQKLTSADSDDYIDVSDLDDLAAWLVEELSGRPKE